jgi:hypothetical protein
MVVLPEGLLGGIQGIDLLVQSLKRALTPHSY